MSYNVSQYDELYCKNVIIPFGKIKKLLQKYEYDIDEDGQVTLHLGGEGVTGTLKDGYLKNISANISSDGSRWGIETFETILKFCDKTAVYMALLVWEGGDSYSLLVLKNGEVKQTNVDIPKIIKQWALPFIHD